MINTTEPLNLLPPFHNDACFSDAFTFIIDKANIGLWDKRLPENITTYSRQYEKILGYDEGEFTGKNETWENLVMPEDIDRVLQLFHEYLSGAIESYKTQYRILCKNGGFIWVQEQAFIIEQDAQHNPKRVLGMIEDITHLKANEEQLEEQKAQLAFIAKIAGFSYWELDIATGILSFKGRSWHDKVSFAIRKGELQHIQAWLDAIHHDDKERIHRALSSLLTGKTDYFNEELRFYTTTGIGTYFWSKIIIHIVEWGEKGIPTRALGTTIDINQLKRTEEQLQAALIQNKRYNEDLKSNINQAMKTLEAAQEFNQIFFDTNPDINLIFSDTFKLIDCNPATVRFFGCATKDEMINNSGAIIASSIPDYQADGRRSIPLAERLVTVARTGYIDFETELITRGKPHSLHIVFKKMPYKDSFVIVCFGVDLTAAKETKQELMYQDRLLRTINEGASHIVMTDTKDFDKVLWDFLKNIGRIIAVHRILIWKNYTDENGRLCTKVVFEWFEGVSPYKNYKSAFKTDYLRDAPSWYEAAKKKEYIHWTPKKFPEKERLRFEKRGVKSSLGIPIYFKSEFWGFFSFDDCKTEHVFTPQEISALHSAAILLVATILKNEATLNLIQSREEAIAASRAKSDFLSRMSHEIRTPMNAIIGMTTIAKKTSDPERLQYCLSRVDAASKQLLGLINDILDMSKIEANKLDIVPKEFDFEKMIQNAVNVMHIKFEEKHQKLIVDFDALFTRSIVGDELRFSQVLLNLLSNANKFTPEDGTIIIKIVHTPVDDTHLKLRVEVADTGIGISPDQQAKLFHSFEQADSSITRKFGGTGLGLALCKKILRLMDGEIWIESEVGKGSAFIFELTLPWGTALTKELELVPSEHIKALVIDDSQDVLEYFAHILSSFSIPCDTALSGAQGIELVKQNYDKGHSYTIVFVDWKLPYENGAEVIREIQRLDKNIASVLISVADWADIEGSISPAITIDHFLPKPVLPSTVYNTIVNLSNHTGIVEQKAPFNIDLTGKLEGKLLLVAEDIEINQEILSSILEETKVSFEFAENGIKAVDKFKEKGEKYDLILMDVQMPELDGLAATQQIRALGTEAAATIPIIAMTANAFNEDINACLAAGMNGHLAKPIDISELMKTLSEYLCKPL
ncbi:MAG: response regulator [Treponema sp.]|jgi:PAS domain S-box-containing protein|nr:response regulator [Treponema sp.]